MARRWRGNGFDLFGNRRPRDARAEGEIKGIYDDAPIPAAPPVVFRQTPYDWNTLWGAAATGYVRILAHYLERGTPPDFPDPLGRTALMYAADFGQTDCLCLLLDTGADPDRRDRDGRTAAFYIGGHRCRETVTVLVNGGAALNLVDSVGETPLIRAIKDGDYERTAVLLENGAGPNFPYLSLESPLDAAYRYQRGRFAALLRAYGGRGSQEWDGQSVQPIRIGFPPATSEK
jgi:ankyrin repeat protein